MSLLIFNSTVLKWFLKLLICCKFSWQLIPNVVNYENWTTLYGDHFEVPASIREALRKKGHVLTGLAGGTIIQFIVQETDSLKWNKHLRKLIAVNDPRKGGFPAGFLNYREVLQELFFLILFYGLRLLLPMLWEK